MRCLEHPAACGRAPAPSERHSTKSDRYEQHWGRLRHDDSVETDVVNDKCCRVHGIESQFEPVERDRALKPAKPPETASVHSADQSPQLKIFHVIFASNYELDRCALDMGDECATGMGIRPASNEIRSIRAVELSTIQPARHGRGSSSLTARCEPARYANGIRPAN